MKTINTITLFLLLLLSGGLTFAQTGGGCYAGQVIAPPQPFGLGQPSPGAIVRVCSPTATGSICSPLTPGGIFSDPGLLNPISNPFTADQNGNYNFCASNGNYLVQTFPQPGATYSFQVTVGIAPSGSYTFSGNNIFTGTNQFSGIELSNTLCTGALAGFSVLCATSAGPEVSINGGGFVFMPTIAGDIGGTSAAPTVTSAHITGGTVNTMARFNATGNPVPSACTDNGATVACTEPISTTGGLSGTTGTFTGDQTVGGTLGVMGAATFGIENGIQIVGNGTNTNIAAAITAAGTTGAVEIPPGYVGTDAINNTNNIALLDFRRNNSAIGIWSVLQPTFPITNFPLGNDLGLHAAGPADIHIRTRDLQVTSSTSTVAATPVTVTVASPTLYGVAQGGNPTALFSTSAAIIIDPGTASEESVGTFTIASGTTLSFTPTKNHTQPFFIRQEGIVFLDNRGVRPESDPTGAYSFWTIADSRGFVWTQLPTATAPSWPNNAPQQVATVTGANGANLDYVLRSNNAASLFRWLNAANTRLVFSVDDNGNARNLSSIGLNGSISGTSLLSPPSSGGVTNTLPLSGGVLVAVPGVTSQKSESAADTNVLTFTPPATVGKYRVSFELDVSAAAAAVLGWTITYKDSNGNAVAPTNLALTQLGAAAPALTFTTSAVSNYSGSVDITIDASATAIVVKFTLASGTITAKASANVERLI